MMKGKIVRCEHWSGTLKLKIDSPENTLLQCNFTKELKVSNERETLWETSNHHISYENFTDYVVFEWPNK